MATALPGDTAINLNAATPELMAVLFDPQKAARLIATRNRQGYLSKDDLAREDVTAPGAPGSGRIITGSAPARRSAARCSRARR
ncbi:type II secretion system protein GspK [Sphingomonas hankookensis]|uniref:type II secretion system protein GspK n=1 Tax=Sphingomonas hankookensis TaxID=563996 RepID=UPI003F7A5A9F